MADDAVLLRILVMKEKGIVMEKQMVDNMMATEGAREILSVEVTIVSSLVITTMRRMTAVKSLIKQLLLLLI
jgi:hypothetical protein